MRCPFALVALTASACSLYTGNHDRDRAVPDATPVVPDAALSSTPKRVFVTSTTHTGALGGLAGADAICAARAAAANLDGTYKAWLSTPAESAAARLTHSSAQYHLVDGTPIAASWDDLVGSGLMHP